MKDNLEMGETQKQQEQFQKCRLQYLNFELL